MALNSAEVFEQEQQNNSVICLNNRNEQQLPLNNTNREEREGWREKDREQDTK